MTPIKNYMQKHQPSELFDWFKLLWDLNKITYKK